MKRLRAALLIVLPIVTSAYFWYVLLAVSGVLTFAYGICLQFGRGYGFMAFGTLALVGSEAIRNGLRRG